MTLGFTEIDCNDYGWLAIVNTYFAEIADYINALEAAQKQATDTVTAEVGAARSGFANLLAKIQDMDGVDANLLSMVQALAAGVGPVVYDPAVSYSKNDVVVHDGGLYICIAPAPVTGVAPPDETAWRNMLGWQKTATPMLAGPLTADEGTTQRISLGASYDASARYWPTVSGGTLSELMQFPDDGGQYAGEWGWEWVMPILDADAVHPFLVYATTPGDVRSNDASWSVTVRDVPVIESAVSWPDTPENYSEGTVSEGIITAPAHTVGCDSATQVLAVSPEVTVLGVTEIPVGFGVLVGFGAAGEYLGPENELQQKRAGDGANIIPEMTGETTNGCTITSSLTPAISDIAGPAWYVGRTSVDSAVRWTESGLCELTIAFDSTKTAAGYSFQAWDSTSTGVDLNPKEWEVYARKTGDDWVKVDSRLLTETWSPGEKLSFDFSEMRTFDDLKFNLISSIRNTTDRMFGTIEIIAAGSVTSTTTSIEIVSNESIKDKIFMSGGLHKHLLVDGQLVEIESVSEVDNGDGTFTITITLKNALPQVPTTVAIPDRCTLVPASYTAAIDGNDFKITGAEIALEDNPDIKRIALAISGPEGMTFNRARAQIKRVS